MDEEVKKRLNNVVIRPFKMYPYRTLLLILSFIISIFVNYSVDLSNPNLIEIFFIYILCILLLIIILPIIIEMGFYWEYLLTKSQLGFIKLSLENDKKKFDHHRKKFFENYNNLRNQLKRGVRKTNTFLLTHNQKNNHILQNIDIFFDTTIKSIEKKEYDLNQKDLDIIDKFLTSFDNHAFKNLKPINIFSLHGFFDEMNEKIKQLDGKLYEETKRDVEFYYEHENFFTKIKPILTEKILHLISVVIASIIIINYANIVSFLIKMIALIKI